MSPNISPHPPNKVFPFTKQSSNKRIHRTIGKVAATTSERIRTPVGLIHVFNWQSRLSREDWLDVPSPSHSVGKDINTPGSKGEDDNVISTEGARLPHVEINLLGELVSGHPSHEDIIPWNRKRQVLFVVGLSGPTTAHNNMLGVVRVLFVCLSPGWVANEESHVSLGLAPTLP